MKISHAQAVSYLGALGLALYGAYLLLIGHSEDAVKYLLQALAVAGLTSTASSGHAKLDTLKVELSSRLARVPAARAEGTDRP